MSFISTDCLDNIIGISESTCDCFPANDTGISASGLFLDQLEGLNLNMVNAGANCEQGNLWDMMRTARDNGIKQFRTYLFTGLSSEYKRKNSPFQGPIGSSKFRSNISLTGSFAGLSVYTNNIRGGYMRIKSIGIAYSENGTFDLDLYNDLEDSNINTFSVTAVANKLNWNLITPIDLPLANETGEYIRYDFLFDRMQYTGLPKDARMADGCNCSSNRNYYDVHKPVFKSKNTAASMWMNFVMASGCSGNNISTPLERDSLSHSIAFSNGIILDVEFWCDVQNLLCQSVSDFDNGDIALAIATCIRYISGAFLFDAILASGNIDFYTMTDRERIMQKKNSYTKEYQNLLEQIIRQFNINGNDCLVCDNSQGPHKRGILA